LSVVSQSTVLDALALVRGGTVHDLGTEYHFEMPRGLRSDFHRFQVSQWRIPTCLTSKDSPRVSFSMDLVQGSPHLGTHVDALIHAQADGRVHGGADVTDVYSEWGWSQHGAETIPPFVGRGVLVDVAAALGQEPLPDLFEIRSEHIRAALDEQGTELRSGDAVLIRTGKFAADYHGHGEAYFKSQPGVGPEAAAWLCDQGMALMGTDTTSTEPFPFPDLDHTTHELLLVQRGVNIIEIMDLESLAASATYEFLFVFAPLKITGSSGAWVRPLAIA
jgi:kynurenine formamidase